MIEAVVILTTFVRAFRFQPLPGHKPRPVARLTLRPAGGMPLLSARARPKAEFSKVMSMSRRLENVGSWH